MVSNKLGDFIRNKRGDMSLRDFAKLCGLSHTHLDSIEKGVDPRTNKAVRPTVETLAKIALGSGVNINELIQLSTAVRNEIFHSYPNKDSEIDFVMKTNNENIILGQVKNSTTIKSKNPKDLIKFLDQSEVMFDGETYKLDEDDKQKLRDALEYAFWHAKQKNKRVKPKPDSLLP